MTLFAEYQPAPTVAPPESRAIVQVRSAGIDDAAGIAALTAERSGAPLEVCLRSVQRQLGADADRGNLTLVADVAGCDGIVGFGRTRFHQGSDASGDGDDAPIGWYLLGVIVTPALRRQGIGTALTRQRLAWIAERADDAYYFANSLNLASIELHRRLGFVEVCRPVRFPGAEFTGGGVGVLFQAPLRGAARGAIC